MRGQIRTAIDRLFALEEGDGNLLRGHDRCCALLMAAEGRREVILLKKLNIDYQKARDIAALLGRFNIFSIVS